VRGREIYEPANHDESLRDKYRYNQGRTILTTNKSIKDWSEILAGDEVTATAVLENPPRVPWSLGSFIQRYFAEHSGCRGESRGGEGSSSISKRL